MNTAHWHLLLNHTPIVGVFIGTLILITGFILRNQSAVKKTALGVFVFAALFSVLAYLTGEGAEEIVESLPDVTEIQIEDHEEAGKLFFMFSSLLGLFSLVTFIYDRRAKSKTFLLYVTVLLFALATCSLAIQTGLSGGKVRHSEIRKEASMPDKEINKAPDSEDKENDD
jgi:uncharacterized membrane protein